MSILSKQSGGEEPINLMPLIDMVFLLLIFFLVATTFAEEEREAELKLAETSSIEPISAPPPQLIVNIMKDGTLKVSGDVVKRNQLSEMLETIVRDDPDRQVLIRADRKVRFHYYAGVVNLCLRKGIRQHNIAYLAKDRTILPEE
jgi:biopolymer transport protein ExbD